MRKQKLQKPKDIENLSLQKKNLKMSKSSASTSQKKFKANKLSTKFILLFTAVLTAIFFLMMLVVQLSSKIYVDKYIEKTVESLQGDIDSGVTEVIDEAAYMYARMVKRENAEMLNNLSSGKTLITRTRMLKELVTLSGMNSNYFVDIGWKGANEYFSINGLPSPQTEVFSAANEKKNAIVLGGYRKGCDILAIHMNSEITTSEGVFVFFLLESTLSDVFEQLNSQTGYSFIVRSDGLVVSHDDKRLVGKTLIFDNLYSLDADDKHQIADIEGVKRIVNVSDMTKLNKKYAFDCYLVNVMNYDFYYSKFTNLTSILLYIALGVFMIGILLAIIRAKSITRPVERLNYSINQVIKSGERSLKTAKVGDEIYQLEKNYDEMISRIFKLMQKNKEEMEIQRKLELEALQMQINPHFLYNTLDAVVWLAKIKKEPEIESLVVNLAQFFRLSLHKGDKYISVAEELEIVRHYCEIEKIRFGDRTSVIFEADENVVKFKTLKLILQPIIENAFKYAIPDCQGEVFVRVYEQNDDIIFEVKDNGVGFDVPSDILKLKKAKKTSGTGYGLFNINERIVLEYGSNYGIVIKSKPGQGTLVTIKIKKSI